MDQTQLDYLKGAVEALLFVSEKPVTLDQLKEAIQGSQTADLKEVLKVLTGEYETQKRGMIVVEIAGGWQMLSSQAYSEYIREFYKTRSKEKLSRPALETLAIIAYKQPVSRTDVEMIRGVNSDGVVMHLLNKGLIKITGRKEVPGRPYVYGTTGQFLEYFGLRSLEDLPKLEEFPALMAKTNDVQPTVNPDAVPAENEAAAPAAELPADLAAEPAAPAVSEAEPAAPAEAQAAPAAEPEGEITLDEIQQALQEELARARTRLDIEELERKIEVSPEFMEPGIGESSGQSRVADPDEGTQQ